MRHSTFVTACRQGFTPEKIMKVRQTRLSRREQRSHGSNVVRPGLNFLVTRWRRAVRYRRTRSEVSRHSDGRYRYSANTTIRDVL